MPPSKPALVEDSSVPAPLRGTGSGEPLLRTPRSLYHTLRRTIQTTRSFGILALVSLEIVCDLGTHGGEIVRIALLVLVSDP